VKEISRAKRLEVVQYYLLGLTYREIEEETGVSHGTVANIISEVESGGLIVPGTAFDQVSDLRQLSLDLRNSGLKPSQALLGINFLKRLHSLQITPEDMEVWSGMAKKLRPPDFPVKEFFEAAKRLHELETNKGKSFETVAEEYTRYEEAAKKLEGEIASLVKSKSGLSEETRAVSSELEALKRERDKLANDVEIKRTKLSETELSVKEAAEQNSRLVGQTRELQRKKTKLSSDVDGKEESLSRLNQIGLADEDLLRLTAFIERVAQNGNLSVSQVREEFFSALALYQDIRGLEHQEEAEAEIIRQLVRQKSALGGEIQGLNKSKETLLGEIDESVISTSRRVKKLGEEAASQVHHEVSCIRTQFKNLLADAVKTGQAAGEMRQMVKEGQDADKSLRKFLREAKERLGGDNVQ